MGKTPAHSSLFVLQALSQALSWVPVSCPRSATTWLRGLGPVTRFLETCSTTTHSEVSHGRNECVGPHPTPGLCRPESDSSHHPLWPGSWRGAGPSVSAVLVSNPGLRVACADTSSSHTWFHCIKVDLPNYLN